ncbi:helix-hairpin-helix domain-containing protein [Thermodesulfobacteriota bacterium]
MMFSAWKKRKQRINGRVNGLRVLLLVVLMLVLLKTGFNKPTPYVDFCDEKAFVQIEGDIRYPGVYTYCPRANLMDLIDRAGGLGDDTSSPSTFESIPVRPGDRVCVIKDDYEWKLFQDGISASYKITLKIPVSLNSESEEGLTAIPGIGPGLARVIVSERDKRGGFKHLDEIKSLYGIGKKVYQRIVPYVKL